MCAGERLHQQRYISGRISEINLHTSRDRFTYVHVHSQEYVLSDEEDTAMFRIDLAILVECLTIFDGCTNSLGSTTALKMMYEGHGEPLKIM